MKRKVRIAVIDGTARKEGMTRLLAKLTCRYLEREGAEVEFLDQGETPLPLYDGSDESTAHKHVQRLFEIVKNADAVVLSSPEYHNSMSAVLKNALDWLTEIPNKAALSGKTVGLIGGGATLGNSGAITQMLMAVRAMHGWSLPKCVVSIPNIWDAFDDSGELLGAEHRARLTEFSKLMVDAVDCCGTKRLENEVRA